MSDEDILVCALADQEQIIPGSTFDYSCAKCKRRVMVAPSGQEAMKKHRLIVMCWLCAAELYRQSQVDNEIGLAASPEDILREMALKQPNLRRSRN